MIGSSLLRYKKEQKYLLFDFESEGLNLLRSRPWQLSYAICTINEIESINVRHFMWPNLKVAAEAAQITRFNMTEHLKLAEPPELILSDFDNLLYNPNYIPVAQNGLGFDIYIHRLWRLLCGQKTDWSYLPRFIDTMCLSKAYRKPFAQTGNRLIWQYKLLNEKIPKTFGGVSLGAMCRAFDLEYDINKAHDARWDVKYMHSLLNKLLWSIEIS